MITVSWSELKSFVDDRVLSIQFVELDDRYLLSAFDGPFSLSCYIRKSGSDVAEFEADYKALGNKSIAPESTIKEEDIKTGGHYQAKLVEVSVGAGDASKTVTVSFPFPISLLAANWVNKPEFEGDELYATVAPNTTIGAITASVAVGVTVIDVQQSVVDNMTVGRVVTLTDGTNTDDCGRCIGVDKANLQLTVETATANAFSPATPTYVQMTAEMLPRGFLDALGRAQLGEAKIGGSYLPAGTPFVITYYNNNGTPKKMRFIMEYLY